MMHMPSYEDVQRRHHDAHAKLRAFHVDDNVYVKDFSNTKKWLPGRTIQVVHRHVDAVKSCSVNITLEEEPDIDQEIPTPVFSRTKTSSVDFEQLTATDQPNASSSPPPTRRSNCVRNPPDY